MNDSRRKRLDNASTLISQAMTLMAEVQDEEQESFDSLPENMQEGEKGEAMEQAIAMLTDAISSLEDAVGNIEEAQA